MMLTTIIVFLKVEEEETKLFISIQPAPKLPPKVTFGTVLPGPGPSKVHNSIHRDLSQGLICFTLDCSFERCLIHLSFSEVLHLGQGLVKDGAPSVPALLGIML